ncbi:hypothetical protein SEA_APIARY_70 [Rhodococcus phage Apiary]|nr:hypothetical protein SEA_BRAXOADDIE_70 [Rhodococcus phage Braxoaddie]WNM64993.1 hypothetical protein SEA_MASELOP_70 [Rhodococcus phage Maselop]WNM67454.1 hypothetical protein SEA_POLYYUKI_70 [Rhodococcus phage Polyyuki]WNM69878.1 hypothetical protein SEA_APIARY_70 [Rhodococcus phage Apiary]
MSKKSDVKTFEVGQKVRIDKQPFEWTVIEVNCDGKPNIVKVQRKCVGELLDKISRKIDTYRLSELED